MLDHEARARAEQFLEAWIVEAVRAPGSAPVDGLIEAATLADRCARDASAVGISRDALEAAALARLAGPQRDLRDAAKRAGPRKSDRSTVA